MKRLLRPLFRGVSGAYGALARVLAPLWALPPIRLTIMLTTRCNLSCPYCSLREQLNQPEEDRLCLSEWMKVIRTIPRQTAVMITGGEPFLAPDAAAILEELLRTGHPVSVVTNATTLDARTALALTENRLSYLMVSLDGMRDYHNRIRGMATAFERAEKVFSIINAAKQDRRRLRPLTCVKTIITGDNCPEIPSLIEYAEHTLRADHFALSLITNAPLQQSFTLTNDLNDPRFFIGNRHRYDSRARAELAKMLAELSLYRKRSRVLIELAPRIGGGARLEEYAANPEGFGVRRCLIPWVEITLHYNGDLSPCIGYRLGNIRDLNHDFGRLRQLERYRTFLRWYSRQRYLPVCEGCCWGRHVPKRV